MVFIIREEKEGYYSGTNSQSKKCKHVTVAIIFLSNKPLCFVHSLAVLLPFFAITGQKKGVEKILRNFQCFFLVIAKAKEGLISGEIVFFFFLTCLTPATDVIIGVMKQ